MHRYDEIVGKSFECESRRIQYAKKWHLKYRERQVQGALQLCSQFQFICILIFFRSLSLHLFLILKNLKRVVSLSRLSRAPFCRLSSHITIAMQFKWKHMFTANSLTHFSLSFLFSFAHVAFGEEKISKLSQSVGSECSDRFKYVSFIQQSRRVFLIFFDKKYFERNFLKYKKNIWVNKKLRILWKW